MIRKPFQWYGGKGTLVTWLKHYVPRHSAYLELFAGAASLLFAKWPCSIETINDVDLGIVNFYRVLRDDKGYKELQRLCDLTPYSRSEYYFCKAHWREGKDEIERAYRWYVVALTSFGGKWGKGFGFETDAKNTVMEMRGSIDALPRFHKRLRLVQVECLDWRIALRNYAVSGDVLVYADPPYIYDGIGSTSYVEHMKEKEHAELLEALGKCPSMVMLGGYPSQLYEGLSEKGWVKAEKQVVANVELLKDGAPRKQRTETLWMNPAHQKRLRYGTLFNMEEVQ